MNTREQYLESATNLLLEKYYFFITLCYKCFDQHLFVGLQTALLPYALFKEGGKQFL